MPTTMSDVVAARVRSARRARGWSAARLADACDDLGFTSLTAAVIANIESGRPDKDGRRRREVTVDELMQLAAALSVSPLLLLLPLEGDLLDVGLGSPLAAADMLMWLEAQRPPLKLSSGQDQASWHRSNELFEAFRAYVAGLQAARSAREGLSAPHPASGPNVAVEGYQRSLTQLSEYAHRLMLLGATPAAPDDLDDLEAAGVTWPPSSSTGP